jgi:hypothetical protein
MTNNFNCLLVVTFLFFLSLSSIAQTNAVDSLTLSQNEQKAIYCVRGTPEPVINKKKLPNSKFILLPDSLTGIETVTYANNEKLIIENFGCEYYTLNFRFETSRFKAADTSNIKYWALNAIELMKQIEPAINSPLNLRKGIRYFSKYISTNKYPVLQHEVEYGSSEMNNTVILNRVQKINKDKYAVELTFSLGPL